jgi:hypothetical protein
LYVSLFDSRDIKKIRPACNSLTYSHEFCCKELNVTLLRNEFEGDFCRSRIDRCSTERSAHSSQSTAFAGCRCCVEKSNLVNPVAQSFDISAEFALVAGHIDRHDKGNLDIEVRRARTVLPGLCVAFPLENELLAGNLTPQDGISGCL